MFARAFSLCSTIVLLVALALASAVVARAGGEDGVVRIKSAYSFADTIARLKSDIAGKGIRFFSEIDQAELAAGAGIKLHPSTLLVFGNPPLGTQFMTSNPNSGLDWPVRVLVVQDGNGDVCVTASPTARRSSRWLRP